MSKINMSSSEPAINIIRRRRIERSAVTLVIFVIAVNLAMAYGTVHKLSSDHNSIANTTDVIIKLKNLQHAVVAADSGKRGYLLTDEDEFLEPYHRSLANLDAQIAAVRGIRTEIPMQAQRIRDLIILVQAKIAEIKRVVDLAKTQHDVSAMKIVMSTDGRMLYNQITAAFDEIEGREYRLLERLKADLKRAQLESYILFGSFFGISLALFGGVLLMRRRNKLQEAGYRQQLEQRAEELEDKVAERTQQLSIYSKELSRSNQELEDFAFVASHDLQEPLRKIRAFSDRLKSLYADALDDKGKDYLNRMQRAASRMSSLIEDLLEFSRIKTRGKEFVELDLNETVASVVDDLEMAIEESGAQIKLDPLPTIMADPSQMNQLFINMLSNAIKFRKAGVKPQVSVGYELVSGELEGYRVNSHLIKIADNGVGFDKEFSEKIFMPFQRLHSRDEFKGNGIGLAVCKRIVERHGGEITVKSETGNGAIFTISLPAVASDGPKDFADLPVSAKPMLD